MQSIIRRHYFILILAAIFLVAVIFGLVRFSSVIQKRVERVQSVKSELASFEANKKIFIDEAKKLDAIESRTETLERYLITKDNLPDLLSGIEALAKNRGVELTINTVDTGKQKEEAQKLTVSFSADATQAAMDAFLADIFTQSYQVQFNKFSLHRNQPDEAGQLPTTWNLLATVEIVSF